jgi:hypothetical protein
LLLRDESSIPFPPMCNPTMRTSSVPRSLIFFCPCTCPPFYIFLSLTPSHHGLILMIIGLKGKRPLEELLSSTIFCVDLASHTYSSTLHDNMRDLWEVRVYEFLRIATSNKRHVRTWRNVFVYLLQEFYF